MRGGAPGAFRTFAKHLVNLFDAAFVIFAALADRVQRFVQYGDQELLDLHVAQAAPAVVRLQLVERGVIGQVLLKMFRAAEGVQVGEDGVALDLARVFYPQVVGIGVHAHHLLLHFIG